MKVLVISKESVGALSIAQRLTNEGHDVKWFSFTEDIIGSGVVDKTPAWRAEIGASDILVCVGHGLRGPVSVAQSLGKPVFGSDTASEAMHIEFEHMQEVLSNLNLSPVSYLGVLPGDVSEVLHNWPKDGLLVTIYGGDWGVDTWECLHEEEYSYVVSNRLDHDAHTVQHRKVGERGSVVGWWNGRKWLKPFHIYWRSDLYSELSSGALVVASNQMLLEKTILPMKTYLKKTTYRGPVFMDCIFQEAGQVNVLNIDMRLRLDYFALLAEGALQGMTDLIFETAAGTATGIRYPAEYVVGDLVYVDNVEAAPILGLNEQNLKHIALIGTHKDDVYTYISSKSGPAFMVTARGESIREAGRRITRSLSNLSILKAKIKNRYRIDIAADMFISKLHEWRHI